MAVLVERLGTMCVIQVEIHLCVKDAFEQSLVQLSNDALFAPQVFLRFDTYEHRI